MAQVKVREGKGKGGEGKRRLDTPETEENMKWKTFAKITCALPSPS